MLINEIEKIGAIRTHSDSFGYKEERFKEWLKRSTPLPGSSGFRYVIENSGGGDRLVIILDPKAQMQRRYDSWDRMHYERYPTVGELSLGKRKWPIENAYEVDMIQVHPNYQRMGIAKALYGIALSIMKVTLLAGSSQSPGGRRNWVSLSNIPGVEILGYVEIDDQDFDQYNLSDNSLTKLIDEIMHVGAVYVGEYTAYRSTRHVFALPVAADTSSAKPELMNIIKKSKFKIYGDMRGALSNVGSGLMAKWTGRA